MEDLLLLELFFVNREIEKSRVHQGYLLQNLSKV